MTEDLTTSLDPDALQGMNFDLRLQNMPSFLHFPG